MISPSGHWLTRFTPACRRICRCSRRMSPHRSTCLGAVQSTVAGLEADYLPAECEHLLEPMGHTLVQPLVGLDLDPLGAALVPERYHLPR